MSGVNRMSMELTPKYALTGESKEFEGHTVYRIRALRNFGNVKAGTLGGWVSDDGAETLSDGGLIRRVFVDVLSHEGNCWIADDAIVIGKSIRVMDDALVCESAIIDGGAVAGSSIVSGHARVDQCASVEGVSRISGNAYITNEAAVIDSIVTDNALIDDSAVVSYGATVQGFAVVKNSATVIGKCVIKDHAIIDHCASVRGEYNYHSQVLYEGYSTTIEDHVLVCGCASVEGVELSGSVVISGFMRLENCKLSENPSYVYNDKYALTVQPENGLAFMCCDNEQTGCVHTFKEWHDSWKSIFQNMFGYSDVAVFPADFNNLCIVTGNEDCLIKW